MQIILTLNSTIQEKLEKRAAQKSMDLQNYIEYLIEKDIQPLPSAEELCDELLIYQMALKHQSRILGENSD